MKIIIAGAGEVGTHLATMLSIEKHDITVIDNDEEKIVLINNKIDILTIVGSTTSFETLLNAKINECDLFISVTETIETNITSCILAKKLNAKKTIARIDNAEYLEKKNKEIFTSLGVDLLIYPQRVAALEIVDLISRIGSNEIIEFADGKLALVVIKLNSISNIIEKSLIEASKMNENFNFRVVAIARKNKTIIPKGNDIFKENDLIYVITKPKYINDLLLESGKEHQKIKNILIVGGSRIGKHTAKQLENKYHIKLIEINREKAEKIASELDKTLVINGDGRDFQLLIDEAINDIDVIISVTNNSETNILLSLLAKQYGIKNVISEVENIEFIDLAENVGIDTIINKKLLAASNIYAHTLTADVDKVKCLVGIDADVLEFIVHEKSKITKRKIKDLNFPENAIIGGLVRGNETHVVTGDTQIQANDRVIIFSIPQSIHLVEKMLK